jgi:hypothetical protein
MNELTLQKILSLWLINTYRARNSPFNDLINNTANAKSQLSQINVISLIPVGAVLLWHFQCLIISVSTGLVHLGWGYKGY